MLSVTCVLFAELPLTGALYMPVLADKDDIPLLAQSDEEATASEEISESEDEIFKSEDVRSVKTSFLLSLAVPGAGELYAGSPIKAGVFVAAEAGFLAGYFIYYAKGKDGEDAYREFADEWWDFKFYYSWFHQFGDDSIYTEQLPVKFEVNASDTTSKFCWTTGETTYYAHKNHDYYEMIGKYDWFVLGWNDVENREAIADSTISLTDDGDIVAVLRSGEADASFRSERRLEYMEMRKDANDQFTTAKYLIGALLLNHLLSAFDAAWTAKRSNDKLYEGFTFAPELDANVALDSRGKPQPSVALNIARF